MQLTQRLAQFALAPYAASPEAHRMIRLSCLDWAACALAGRGEPVAKSLRKVARAETGAPEAHIIRGGRGPARAAALVNGATSHALDYDDTHFAHIGHPSVAVFPAALAVGEREGRTFAEILEAALLGVEASIRVGLWLGRGHYQVGFHQTATAGAFGAVIATARLKGLSEVQTQHALSLAATKAAGIKAQFGTMGKPLNAGLGAECGVMATDWAATGMISDPAALDGTNGFGETHHGQGNLDAFDNMGTKWQFETISHKFHACCHGLHAMLEALHQIDTIPEQLTIHTHPRWMTVCNIATPTTGLEAKFSYTMTAAMALSGIDTSAIASFNDALAERDELHALMTRIQVIADESLTETACRILADGVVATYDLAAPMSIETRSARVFEKAQALTERAELLQAAIDTESYDDFQSVLFKNAP